MSTLEIAEALADKKHFGQKDRGGKPYIEHPKRVSNSLFTTQEKIVGILHDVIEDTDTTYQEILDLGFGREIVVALDCLTKREGEHRISAAHRAAANRLACAVKIADVTDNMNISRIPNPTEKDYQRLEQYKKVLEILLHAKETRWNNFADRNQGQAASA